MEMIPLLEIGVTQGNLYTALAFSFAYFPWRLERGKRMPGLMLHPDFIFEGIFRIEGEPDLSGFGQPGSGLARPIARNH